MKNYKNSFFYLIVVGIFSALIYWTIKNGKLLEKPDVDKYYEMEVYLKSAEVAADKGDKDKAIEIFQNIQKQLNKLTCVALV